MGIAFTSSLKNKHLDVYLVIAISLIGTYLRLSYYVQNRSFWLDEARLALNIVNKSFINLFKPLDFNQSAPVGFLLLQKIMITFLGNWDYILRLIPLLSGIFAIPLMFFISKRFNQTITAQIVAIGLFSFSERLIYYSTEMKQYSCDVFVALVLLLIADSYIEKPDNSFLLALLGIMGALALWLSHPSLFVISGITISLVLQIITKKDSQLKLPRLAGIFSLWVLSFWINYEISLKPMTLNTHLTNYWQSKFMPFPPWNNFSWFKIIFIELLNDPVRLPTSVLTTVLLILGGFSLLQRQSKYGIIVIAPIISTLVASAFEKYPFGSRLMLFAVPLMYLLIAESIGRIHLCLKKVNPTMAVIVLFSLGIYLIFPQVQLVYKNLLSPNMGEHIKPVMVYLRENRQSRDKVYLYYSTGPAFEYYSPFYGFTQSDHLTGIKSRSDPDLYLKEIDTLKNYDRVWFMFSHNCSWCKVDEQNFILTYLDEIGIKIDEYKSIGATLYLYDLKTLPP